MFNNLTEKYSREDLIKVAGRIGIGLNVLIAVIKLIIGTVANSISIISDAVNNLTDAMSSAVTLVGLKLSQRQPDKKHPLGYGRVEYLSAMTIAVIVSITGFQFLQTSYNRILHPESVSFSSLQLIILCVAILIKLFLSRLNLAFGKAAKSSALEASGTEAIMDVLVSTLTIVSAIIAKATGWQLDGYMGVLLSLFILYTGVNLIRNTISQIIGERPEKALVETIREDLAEFENIKGSYDFIIHNYGPVTRLGTANLEFEDKLLAADIYNEMQKAQKKMVMKHSIYFTFGMYAINTYDSEVMEIQTKVEALLKELPYFIGLHAFYLNKEQKYMEFDVIVTFHTKDFNQTADEMVRIVTQHYPEYEVNANIDLDYA